MSRCSGHCCERFNMQYSYEEFQRMKLAKLEGAERIILDNGEQRCVPSDPDVIKIADMLIPLLDNTHLDHNLEPMIAVSEPYRDGFKVNTIGTVAVLEGNWFTCKHFNKETRDCTSYEDRPAMCRKHPYYDCSSQHCAYHACTLAKKEMNIGSDDYPKEA